MTLRKYLNKSIWPSPHLLQDKNNRKWKYVTGNVAHITACQERNGHLCKFCEKDETTSAPLPTLRPYPNYGKLPNLHYLSWNATPTNGHEPDDFQPRAQIKRLFEESKLVSGDSGAVRKFSDKYIVPEKLVAEYAEHLA